MNDFIHLKLVWCVFLIVIFNYFFVFFIDDHANTEDYDYDDLEESDDDSDEPTIPGNKNENPNIKFIFAKMVNYILESDQRNRELAQKYAFLKKYTILPNHYETCPKWVFNE